MRSRPPCLGIRPLASLMSLTLTAVWTASAIGQPVDPAPTPGGDGGSVMSQIDAMRREMDKLQQDNQSMKSEIDTLRAETDEDWLTEARADEIRGLVQDVLADADVRSSLQSDGMTAGWADHFFLASSDGRFKLTLEGQMQVRYIYNYHDQPDRHRQGWEVTRASLRFHGHVFSPDITYYLRIDPTRNEPGLVTGLYFLNDAWIRYALNDDWSVRVGQFKLPFNREELVSSSYQLAVERSLVNEAMNLGRSQGVELTYTNGASRASLALSDGASGGAGLGILLNNQGTQGATVSRINSNALLQDVEYAVTGRYEHLLSGNWNQFVDFTSPIDEEFGMLLGFAVHAQQGESTNGGGGARDEARFIGGTADLSMEFGGANFFISASHYYIDAANSTPTLGVINFTGIVAQFGIYVAPKWEVFVRGEYGQFDGSGGSTLDFPDLNLVTTGFNYYLEGHDLKWTTDIGFGISDVSGAIWAADIAGYRGDNDEVAPQVVFRTQIQLLF